MFDRVGQYPGMLDLVGQNPMLGVGQTVWPLQQGGCPPYAYGAPAFPVQQTQMYPAGPPAAPAFVPSGVADMAYAPSGMGQYPNGYGGYGGYGQNSYGPPVNPVLVQQIQQTAAFFRPRFPTRLEKQWLGFPRVKIRKCETVRICVTAQVYLKVIRIYIPTNVAFGLLVDDIIVAKEHLVNGAAVPAEVFGPESTDVRTSETETLCPGTDICIILTNVSDDDLCVSVGAQCWVGY